MRDALTGPELARSIGVAPHTFNTWLRRQWRAGHALLRERHLNERYRFDPDTARILLAQYRVSQQRRSA